MENILDIETFDTSILADAILGEDNELIFLTDDEQREEDLFADSADDWCDEAWMDADALASVGWGNDEDY